MPHEDRAIIQEERRYPFRVAPAEDGWTIWFPDLPGCMGWAETLDQIAKEAETVLGLWIETEVERRHPIPEPTDDGSDSTWTVESYKVEELPEPELLTVRDVSKKLGVSVRRVHQLATDRKVGRIIGGARIFLPSEIDALAPRPTGRPRVSAPNNTKQSAAP
jgi:predicted RNase H-like HicB family nuclease